MNLFESVLHKGDCYYLLNEDFKTLKSLRSRHGKSIHSDSYYEAEELDLEIDRFLKLKQMNIGTKKVF